MTHKPRVIRARSVTTKLKRARDAVDQRAAETLRYLSTIARTDLRFAPTLAEWRGLVDEKQRIERQIFSGGRRA